MLELLDSLKSLELAGNTLWSWGLATATAFCLYLVLSVLLRFLRRNLHRFSETTSTEVDDILKLCRAFATGNIEFAYPTRTLYLSQ